MAQSKENTPAIVMFPFMAQGHIIPFLALSLQIEQRGFDIIFVNTPLNIKKLRQSIPPSSAIRLREIPYDSSCYPGLPPAVENTDVLPPHLIFPFIESSISLKPAFRHLVSDLVRGGAPPLAVVADMFFGWSAEIAREFGVFHAIFSSAGGFGIGCYCSLWLNMPHRKTNSPEFFLPDFQEAGLIHLTQLAPSISAADGSDTDTKSVFMRKNILEWSDSDGVLFNSVEELDKIGLDYFRRITGRNVWPVGPIFLTGDNRKISRISPEKCTEWLDTKPTNSVLFVSFGSNNTISASQMMQLGRALERATNTHFIWVVRPPLGFDITAEFKAKEWLPEGFMQRVVVAQNRGLVVVQWAPQVEILLHESVGAFLTHCGWNSVLESLSRGVPLIGWPMAAEQFFNAKFLEEEVGVCVEVARGVGFEVRCEDLVEKIEMVMGESEKGMEMRRKAGEVKKMIEDAVRDDGDFEGSSVVAMDEFLNAVLLKKQKMEEKILFTEET
ncbi:hypothetical protein RHMOL_Rhmol13G0295000 [Rhododendron molle]|uniref:Uncharacterized protein n=1 Tax=Rhododendron molle TaxID=49168 RepID=A0ACC0LD19_RHOML|nr:hypothetical protein RHMOL_Rhmol13G0295000 [Rhododendron molle]